jgi:hypothetical protein
MINGIGTLVRIVQANCRLCKKKKNVPATQLMAALPLTRLENKVKAFEHCGMDFAGPFFAKVGRGKPKLKVYVMVITCLAVRAVHFELTVNMGTDNVINALVRFCAIRGTPNSIRTDNAPQFHKADKDVCDWIALVDWDKVVEKTGIGFCNKTPGINWFFNPPFAPHFGGVFEIVVKAAKRAMTTVAGSAELTEEEFRTLVYVCADKLNDRPIGIRGDVEDLVTLKPNDFLTRTRTS